MEYREEADKIRSMFADEKITNPTGEDVSLSAHRVSRVPKLKPDHSRVKQPEKSFSSVKILDVHKEEKDSAPEQWNRAALHAHHCCVSQKHPAFVHLQRLLLKIPPLNRRVALWRMQEYLHVAKKLEAFVKEQVEESSPKKRQFSAFVCAPEVREEEKQKEQWEEYLHAQEERLFQVRNPTK